MFAIAVAAALLGVLFLCLNHVYSYWRRKGLPQPPVVFGFGNILDVVLFRSSPGLIYDQIYRSYPDHEAVGVYGFFTPRLLVRSPKLFQRVLVSDFSSFHDNEFYVSQKLDPHFYMDPFCLKGEEWKRVRAKLMTTLTSARVKEVFPLMKEIVPRLEAFVDERLGEDMDAKELVDLFTMDNVSSTVFGISSNCFSDPGAAFRRMADIQMKDQLQTAWKTLVLATMPTVRDAIGLKFVPTSVSDYIENLIHEVMEYRIKNNLNRNDLFQQFMKKYSSAGDDFNEMMFFGITFFLEGFETSSMTASKILYELAMNPEVQQTLYEEVREAFDTTPDLDYDTLTNLPYLNKVLQETGRKYPIMYAYIRECTKPIALDVGGKSVKIDVGTPVIVPVFSVHHDPLYYPDPDLFDPERFTEENKAARPACTYMPFGEGPRMCPGIKFGMTQMKLLVVNLVYKYRLLRCQNTPPTLTWVKGSFLAAVPNEKLCIRIEKR